MKRNTTKSLSLSRSTVRVLAGDRLARVGGGTYTSALQSQNGGGGNGGTGNGGTDGPNLGDMLATIQTMEWLGTW